jgi:hypothetical protein
VTEQQQQDLELIQVSFSGELPSQLADLRTLQEDFEFAKNCATAYLNLNNVRMDDASRQVVSRGLWVAAAISYRRGFTTGRTQLVPQGSRLKIPQSWYDSLKPGYREAHEQILEVANQQIAHHTGKNEHVSVVALLAPPPQPRALAGVAVTKVAVASPGDERVRELGTLCQGLIEGLERRFGELGDEFEEFVKAQNLHDLYEDPTRINNNAQ